MILDELSDFMEELGCSFADIVQFEKMYLGVSDDEICPPDEE